MKKNFLTVLFLLLSHNAFASNCAQLYPNNQEIVVANTVELCNSFFVTRFDTVHNVPVFSSEILKPNQPSVPRLNDFHPDDRLDKNVRAENSDYDGSGWDKGHMTPAEDAATVEQMRDTFLLSNMSPQQPSFNRISWRMLEEMVHQQVNSSGKPTHIITGVIFNNYNKTIGAHHIAIPVAYYKIVYLDSGIEAFYGANVNNSKVQHVSIADLQKYVSFKIQ